MTAHTKYILCMDGGGIRGLIQAIILQELVEALARCGWNHPMHQTFDLIAGTSTGGIVASGLCVERPDRQATTPPHELIKLYEEDGPALFSRSPWQRVKTVGGLLAPRYSNKNIVHVLQKHLGSSTKLSDARTRLLLTAYDLEARQAKFLTNCQPVDPSTKAAFDDYLLWQATAATTAAPTYFPPMPVQNLTTNRVEVLIDGGVFANDPVLAAIVEGFKMGWHLDEMVILSLGTGMATRPFTGHQANKWGPLSWINPALGSPIISIFMQGQASTASYQVRHLLNGFRQYFRIDRPLVGPNDDLDDVSPGNLGRLKDFGAKLCQQFADEIATFAKMRAQGHISGIEEQTGAMQAGAIDE